MLIKLCSPTLLVILHQFPFFSSLQILLYPSKSFLSCFIVLNITGGSFNKEYYHSLFVFCHSCFGHRNNKMFVHGILLFTIRTCNVSTTYVPLFIYCSPPVNYMQRSNDVPLYIIFYHSPPVHVAFQRCTIDYRPVWASLRLAPITGQLSSKTYLQKEHILKNFVPRIFRLYTVDGYCSS